MSRSRVIKRGDPFVDSFMPRGRTESVVYAVQVRDHPDWVKVGRTTKWRNRRQAYANWNLRNGDGIIDERIFKIVEEYVDLVILERDLLQAMPFPVVYGREWFCTDIDETQRFIDKFLWESDLSYEYC